MTVPSPSSSSSSSSSSSCKMTSLETRSSSALFKRAEQLQRWQESETARESAEPRTNVGVALPAKRAAAVSSASSSRRPPKVQFTDGCVFLAACAAADKEEVGRLVDRGADIDTANVDGLTALHQVGTDEGQTRSRGQCCHLACQSSIDPK